MDNRISSTEKLLNVIRDKGGYAKEYEKQVPDSLSVPPKTKAGLSNLIPFKGTLTVGIELGYNEIRLALMRSILDRKHALQRVEKISFDPKMSKNGPEFADFLRNTLKRYCGSRRAKIWSIVSADQVDARYLKIPRVHPKEMYNVAFWTYKKSGPFGEVDTIFDFKVSSELIEDGVKKLGIIAYTVPKKEIHALKRIFQNCGFPLTGITTFPFANQNLFYTKWIDTAQKDVCCLFIGRNQSRIDLFYENNLILSRDIRAGTNSILESIKDGINEQLKGQEIEIVIENGDGADTLDSGTTTTVPREGMVPIDLEEARAILHKMIAGSNLMDVAIENLELKFKDIFQMIIPAIDRLLRQIERTFEHYAMNYKGRSVTQIFTMGQIAGYNDLLNFLSSHLRIPVALIDPFPEDEAASDIAFPDDPETRATYTWTLGLALSSNSLTPNFIHTFKDKQNLKFIKKVNQSVVITFLFILAVLAGIYSWQEGAITTNTALIEKLERQLNEYKPLVDQGRISSVMGRIQKNRILLTTYAKHYQSVAFINEIATLTPENIKLLNFTAQLAKQKEEKVEGQSRSQSLLEEVNNYILFEGIIQDNADQFDMTLASYLMDIKRSPILGPPLIKTKNVEILNNKEVLRFVIKIEI